MIKEFMLTRVIPQLQRNEEGKMLYIKDPVRAAVIMLSVWSKLKLKLDYGEFHRLCSALCLPKLEKEEFLKYWADLSQSVATLKK